MPIGELTSCQLVEITVEEDGVAQQKQVINIVNNFGLTEVPLTKKEYKTVCRLA